MTPEFKITDPTWRRFATEKDDSGRIQRMMNAAGKHADSTGTWPALIFPGTANYLIPTTIKCHSRVTRIKGDGASTFIGNGANDGFDWSGDKFWRGRIEGVAFSNMDRALVVPTANTDAAHQVFDGITADSNVRCIIDQVSFDASRSTTTVVKNVVSAAKEVGRFYSDIFSLENSTIQYTGGSQVLTLDSRASVKDCLFTPMQKSTDQSAWIKLLSSELGRGIDITGCRFGSESGGGMPVVESWAAGNCSFGADIGYQTSIRIADSIVSPCGAPIPRRSVVLLHAMPNTVTLERLSSNTAFDGLVGAASDYVLPSMLDTPRPAFRIEIDEQTLCTQMRMNPPLPVAKVLDQYYRRN